MIPADQTHAAAAEWHRRTIADPCVYDPAPALAKLPGWGGLNNRSRNKVERDVRRLVEGAADVSAWAVDLGAAGLAPCDAHAWRTGDGINLAVQLAAGLNVLPAVQREVTRAVHTAVEDVYARLLGRTPQQ